MSLTENSNKNIRYLHNSLVGAVQVFFMQLGGGGKGSLV